MPRKSGKTYGAESLKRWSADPSVGTDHYDQPRVRRQAENCEALHMTDVISLTEMPMELRDRGLRVSYSRLYRAAIEGDIPAKRVSGRWCVEAGDVPAVEAHFTPAQA